ncbi:MAG: hypothetical protein HY255_01525 [Betaproteobacteria bacterium]|nr:hypothetical protein [Betaproteobacteria bacterium]
MLGAACTVLAGCGAIQPIEKAPVCVSSYVLPADVLSLTLLSIGESHGTSEVPQAIGDLACSFLTAHKAVVVGLEIPDVEQVAIDSYLRSPGAPQDQAAMLSGRHWRGKDGRGSVAMAALIFRMRDLKQAGLPIEVLAFDHLSQPGSPSKDGPGKVMPTRDEAMVENIGRAIARAPGKTFILLSGDHHASKQEKFAHDPDWRSMAFLLKQRHAVASFKADYESGTAWQCHQKKEGGMDCGTKQAGGFNHYGDQPSIRIDGAWTMEWFPKFDGTLWLGKKVTASPPAVPAP